jgi:carboxyl-terminal processing protease
MSPWSRTFRAATAGWLLACGAAAFAQAPAAPAPPVASSPLDDAVASLQASYLQAVPAGEQADQYRDLVATVFRRLQRHYVNDLDLPALVAAATRQLEAVPPGAGQPGEVFQKAMNAALKSLDPYSRYLDPQGHENARSETNGSFGGLGLELELSEGAVRVVAPMPGSPAAKAGLRAGDFILRVDDHALPPHSLSDAIARMRGEPGTPVSLTVRRAGPEGEFNVALTRDTIRRQPIRWSMEGDVLVLRLATFSSSAASAVEQAIAEASAGGAPRAVVLDLRGNGGGLLREAVKIADAFLTQGEIVSLRSRASASQRSWQADPAELLPGAPMVVLVDGRSASASELVAAALQENGRAVVMGQRSYGKGTVQTTFTLGEQRGALKLTTAVYHGPSGATVNGKGVPLDVELTTTAQLGAKSEAKTQVPQARCPLVWKSSDAPLACALGYLRSGSVEAFVEAAGR